MESPLKDETATHKALWQTRATRRGKEGPRRQAAFCFTGFYSPHHLPCSITSSLFHFDLLRRVKHILCPNGSPGCRFDFWRTYNGGQLLRELGKHNKGISQWNPIFIKAPVKVLTSFMIPIMAKLFSAFQCLHWFSMKISLCCKIVTELIY